MISFPTRVSPPPSDAAALACTCRGFRAAYADSWWPSIDLISSAVREPASGRFWRELGPGDDIQASLDVCPEGACLLLKPGKHEVTPIARGGIHQKVCADPSALFSAPAGMLACPLPACLLSEKRAQREKSPSDFSYLNTRVARAFVHTYPYRHACLSVHNLQTGVWVQREAHVFGRGKAVVAGSDGDTLRCSAERATLDGLIIQQRPPRGGGRDTDCAVQVHNPTFIAVANQVVLIPKKKID